MNFRITDDEKQCDIDEIDNILKLYNLSNREKSENIHLGVYYKDKLGKKLVGLIKETLKMALYKLFICNGKFQKSRSR